MRVQLRTPPTPLRIFKPVFWECLAHTLPARCNSWLTLNPGAQTSRKGQRQLLSLAWALLTPSNIPHRTNKILDGDRIVAL